MGGPATIGLLGAGDMGSALGRSWLAGGARVLASVGGRSRTTVSRIEAAGIEPVNTLTEVLRAADVVVCTVPPAQAESAHADLVQAATQTRERPLVVDANAVSPTTISRVEQLLATQGLELVDASVSGPPPRESASAPPRLYLSGPRATEVDALASPWVQSVVLSARVGDASALKMCTASMYKGTNALVMQALVTAHHYGLADQFLADVSGTWPANVPRWPDDVVRASGKAWRFVDEMLQIAETQESAGMSGDLFRGVAGAYARAADTDLGRLHGDTGGVRLSIDEIARGLTAGEPA